MGKETIIIQIQNGEIQDKKAIRDFFRVKDGRYMIDRHTAKRRTNPQNRYYHGLVVPMIRKGIEDMGNEITIEETHEFLKARFNSSELVNTSTGEMINVPKSTTRLTTVEFNDFISKVQQFAAEFLGISIPDPGEQGQMEF